MTFQRGNVRRGATGRSRKAGWTGLEVWISPRRAYTGAKLLFLRDFRHSMGWKR
jgi:hypothetical protein